MKTVFALALSLAAFSSLAQASVQPTHAQDLARVRQLADRKIEGSDVKKDISVYTNTDGNPCAPAGISYIVKVMVRHSVLQNPDAPTAERPFELVNTYYIDQASLHAGKDLDDSLCQE